MRGPLSVRIAIASLALVLAACRGGGVPTGDSSSGGDARDEAGGGGGAAATVTIGDETWELPNVACRVRGDGTESFSLVASVGLIGLSLSELSLYADILERDGIVHQVVLTEGPLGDPTLHRMGASDSGEMTISIDGERITARGTFDDMLTTGVAEDIPGTVEADCGTLIADEPEPSMAPAEADGFVTVDGTTYEFSFGDPPLCNMPGQDGRVGSRPVLVDDPDSQVTFTYATAEMSTTGEPSMQIIINGPDGSQLWYSAVGYSGIPDSGSVDSIAVDGDTVRISGTLENGTDESIVADFTAEATCEA